MRNKQLKTLCEGAVMVALSVVISFIKIKTGGQGGSIDFVMIPLLVFALRNGCLWGIGAGAVFGFIKCLVGGGIGYGLPSVLLDYVLAYAAVGFAGIAKNKKYGALWGTALGCIARFGVHFISGLTIYAITAAEEIAGIITANVPLYSLIYNGLYMLPNTVVALIIMPIVAKALKNTAYHI